MSAEDGIIMGSTHNVEKILGTILKLRLPSLVKRHVRVERNWPTWNFAYFLCKLKIHRSL